MQLDKVSARIAPRTTWQAMDMGAHLYRAWWQPLTLIWLAFSLPVLLLALWLTHLGASGWGVFLLWWLKPVLERPLLEYCAKRLFSQPINLKQLVKEFPRYALPGLLPWLLWRRFYLTRSFSVPIAQLERLTGQHYRQRCRVLAMGGANRSVLLTLMMAHIEFILSYALTVLAMMLLPGQYYLSEVDWFLQSSNAAFIGLLTWYLTLMVLEPLYVSSGFALYLNKRTWLEGWDIELGLRRLGQRRQAQHANQSAQAKSHRAHGGAALLLLFFLPALFFIPTDVQASEADHQRQHTEVQAHQQAQQQAISIVAADEFMPMHVEQQWQRRDQSSVMTEADDPENSWLYRLLRWLFEHSGNKEADSLSWLPSAAELLRVLLWSLVISLLLWSLWHYRGWLASLPQRLTPAPAPPSHISGLDIRPSSLPKDLSAAVLAALAQADYRAALGLLYRGTLSRLMLDSTVFLPLGATELEVLAQCRQHHPDSLGVALLADISEQWLQVAWGQRAANHAAVVQLQQRWQQHFTAANRSTLKPALDAAPTGDPSP